VHCFASPTTGCQRTHISRKKDSFHEQPILLTTGSFSVHSDQLLKDQSEQPTGFFPHSLTQLRHSRRLHPLDRLRRSSRCMVPSQTRIWTMALKPVVHITEANIFSEVDVRGVGCRHVLIMLLSHCNGALLRTLRLNVCLRTSKWHGTYTQLENTIVENDKTESSSFDAIIYKSQFVNSLSYISFCYNPINAHANIDSDLQFCCDLESISRPTHQTTTCSACPSWPRAGCKEPCGRRRVDA